MLEQEMSELPIYFGKKGLEQMGGRGSGSWIRKSSKPLVENALKLDLCHLKKIGALASEQATSGTLHWVCRGESFASIGFECHLPAETHGSMRLNYNCNGKPVNCIIDMLATKPNFGGQRWWFICPIRSTKATKLFLMPGSKTFASREAHGLTYQSRNETRHNRLLTKAFGIRGLLGGSADMRDPFPKKPNNMHWQTYWQLCIKYDRAAQTALLASAKNFEQLD